jgi:ectopic P granules protein 5
MVLTISVVNRLWLVIRDLYSPWLLPYTQQQVNADCAAWIQQLSSDRKLLLPWIAADSSLAASMVASLTSCVSFLHETIPSQQQSALSHVLAFYLQGYCHSGMKPHIYHVLHEGLQSLPWHTLTPSLTDLEQVVRVTGNN